MTNSSVPPTNTILFHPQSQYPKSSDVSSSHDHVRTAPESTSSVLFQNRSEVARNALRYCTPRTLLAVESFGSPLNSGDIKASIWVDDISVSKNTPSLHSLLTPHPWLSPPPINPPNLTVQSYLGYTTSSFSDPDAVFPNSMIGDTVSCMGYSKGSPAYPSSAISPPISYKLDSSPARSEWDSQYALNGVFDSQFLEEAEQSLVLPPVLPYTTSIDRSPLRPQHVLFLDYSTPGSQVPHTPSPQCFYFKSYKGDRFTVPFNARFFVIKSYSILDINASFIHNIWTSTELGNKRLARAYADLPDNSKIFLFFLVNSSGKFCGISEMISAVDFTRSSDIWSEQTRWKGIFDVDWLLIKDVPNRYFQHLRVASNEQKPVTNSRDTQEVPFDIGISMMKIVSSFR